MMSIWISFSTTHDSVRPTPSHRMFPKITPVSVEETCTTYMSVCRLIFGRKKTNFNRSFDAQEAVRGECMNCRPFNQLQVSQGCKVKAKILERICSLVDKKHVLK